MDFTLTPSLKQSGDCILQVLSLPIIQAKKKGGKFIDHKHYPGKDCVFVRGSVFELNTPLHFSCHGSQRLDCIFLVLDNRARQVGQSLEVHQISRSRVNEDEVGFCWFCVGNRRNCRLQANSFARPSGSPISRCGAWARSITIGSLVKLKPTR